MVLWGNLTLQKGAWRRYIVETLIYCLLAGIKAGVQILALFQVLREAIDDCGTSDSKEYLLDTDSNIIIAITVSIIKVKWNKLLSTRNKIWYSINAI